MRNAKNVIPELDSGIQFLIFVFISFFLVKHKASHKQICVLAIQKSMIDSGIKFRNDKQKP